MVDAGWVADDVLFTGGVYCRPCAHLLRIARRDERCAWCAAPLVEEERAEREGWVYFSDEYGELHACCPACLARTFGIAGRLRLHDLS
jgi:hypothetical protein